MKIEMVSLSDLVYYEANPKTHPPEQVAKIAASIKKFGFRQPLVIDDDNVIAVGHGRFLAAKKLRLKKAPCVRASDLTPEEIREYRLADNVTAESEWIDDNLEHEIRLLDEAGVDCGWMGLTVEDVQQEIEAGVEGVDGEKPEVEFTRELLLEHNYIVLYFDNPFDWQVAQEKFELKKVKDLIPRKGQPTGIGRVLSGAKWLERIK